MKRRTTAYAPATVGNAAVGFDVLGFAVKAAGDRVSVERIDEPQVRIEAIRGVATELPTAPDQNTATVGLLLMREELSLDFGFSVTLEKGISLGSGMGGSAASAVGAVVAANALLDEPLPTSEQFRYALAGEAVASGHAHPDNVAPCLYGGLTLATADEVHVVPSPRLWVALVHPRLRIDTRMAREVLPEDVSLSDAVAQMGHLASFVDACHAADGERAARHCVDLIAEPHRKKLVPGFDEAREAALEAGALAFSLSGSGPTVFALARERADAQRACDAIRGAFASAALETESWVSPFGARGATVEVEQ
jgi:homoserine kinase